MDWKDVAGEVGKAAPLLGTVLGGPAGDAVGDLVAAVLGTQATPDAVSKVLLADPNAAAPKLKELEGNAKVQLQQLAVTAAQNRLQSETAQSVAQAASRKPTIQRPRDWGLWIRPLITCLMVAGAFGIVYCVFFGRAEELMNNSTASVTIGTVIGYWFSELKQTLAFWFGTTQSERNSSAEVLQFAVTPGSVTEGTPDAKEHS
jgi:hypothetical protein